MVGGHERWTDHERIDRSCDLLGSAYRRRVVYTLRKDGSATLGELADAVVASELATDRQRAMASLVHTHLPKLADFDVVEYDDPEDGVALSDGVEALEPFLTLAARQETDGAQLVQSDEGPDAIAGNAPD
ncbi:DUF7344 domain-containing protein [Halorussus caseinilyticus]|uniref:DUF7344 domain-containing protein n=1 Tax=Halorussus caseinilyticus TaxID=3034025 RepID=A0ABD5WNF2_9EURY|nr:hypothetical protein [Halorussus sp. DT72]